MVDSYRAKLSLLGVSAQDIQNMTPQSESGPTLQIVAPAAGVVTARQANVGLNVDPSMSLFTVATYQRSGLSLNSTSATSRRPLSVRLRPSRSAHIRTFSCQARSPTSIRR